MKHLTNEKMQFIKDLDLCFKPYTNEVRNVVLKHIDELYEDDAIVYLVKTYAKELKRVEEHNQHPLLSAYIWENEKVRTDKVSCVYDFHEALYHLCYHRYLKEGE